MTDFSAARAVLQTAIDRQFLPGASYLISVQGELVDSFSAGYSEVATQKAFAPDTICRAFSNTKLASTVLVMKLVDDGKLSLDDPISQWIPAFANLRVLRTGAKTFAGTEPLQSVPTVRQLLSHQGGLVHSVFDPDTLLYQSYRAAGIRGNDTSLAELVDLLVQQPLAYQPGTSWEYGMGLDVMARVVEIITGLDWPNALQTLLFEPLGMVDTAHVVRRTERGRLATLYRGPDLFNPFQPGLQVATDVPWPHANIEPVRRTAGGGGLVTTQADWMKLLHQLIPGHPSLLQPATLQEMLRDQLPASYGLQFAHLGPMPQFGYGLGGAYTRRATAMQPNSPIGEFQWGGLGGTHWCVDPARGICIVQMTQRFFGFWNPFWFEFKTRVYEALG